MEIKKISTTIIIDGFDQNIKGWLISKKLFKSLKKDEYLDKYYHLSVDGGRYDLVKIVSYIKSKKSEHSIKETFQYINVLDRCHKTLVRIRYLEKELIKKGEIEVEYYNMYTSDLLYKKELSVYVAQ